MRSHLRGIRTAQSGADGLRALQFDKLIKTLEAAASSDLTASSVQVLRDCDVRYPWNDAQAELVVAKMLARLPLLARGALRAKARAALTMTPAEFVHYYESSGTTGDAVAAPKALHDLVVNTMNIGEMWGRFLSPGDSALILINGPFAPAGYQFEKVLEYIGVMSTRLWTDNVTGDYTRILDITRELHINTFVGTASRLLEMAQFALRHGCAVPRFSRLLLMAEQTGPHLARHLERLTGARVYVCSYGASETGTVAVACEDGQLHLQEQSYLAEIHDDDGTRLIADGPDRGELVLTTLDLPARPLVRYRTGDLVEVTGKRCECGLATPVIRPLGRAQDVLAFNGIQIRQEDVEALLWPSDPTGVVVLNYMLVLSGDLAVCLVTTDRRPDPDWHTALERRLATLSPASRLAVRVVEALPPLSNMGSYVGWKLSRVLDLEDSSAWHRLPEPIRAVLEQTLTELDAVAIPTARAGSRPHEGAVLS
ncbi:phenylacetate--CoA ligase family protein [Amycolatopsis japonica]|uniref:phenylacetate--CoA ligase family protein n=1 Tax=Amycolatopsis japonica TaxID=208439 RepID=UPI00366F6B49